MFDYPLSGSMQFDCSSFVFTSSSLCPRPLPAVIMMMISFVLYTTVMLACPFPFPLLISFSVHSSS